MKKSMGLCALLLACQPLEGNGGPLFKFGTQMGSNPSGVRENSGMSFSPMFNRLYFINDSSAGPRIHIASMNGELIQRVDISDAKNKDWEAFSVGPCGDGDSCLFAADIGDNSQKRKEYTIYVIKEKERYEGKAELFARIIFSHPDGKSSNHEGMAVHPLSGEIFVATKNYEGKPTDIYRIAAQAWQGQSKVQVVTEKWGTVHYPDISTDLGGQVPPTTAFSISPSGAHFMLLADGAERVWEYAYDLSLGKFERAAIAELGREIKIDPLGQEESMDYLDEDNFFYSSEGRSAPIVKVIIQR